MQELFEFLDLSDIDDNERKKLIRTLYNTKINTTYEISHFDGDEDQRNGITILKTKNTKIENNNNNQTFNNNNNQINEIDNGTTKSPTTATTQNNPDFEYKHKIDVVQQNYKSSKNIASTSTSSSSSSSLSSASASAPLLITIKNNQNFNNQNQNNIGNNCQTQTQQLLSTNGKNLKFEIYFIFL